MTFQRGFVEQAAGSVLASCGRTKVLCTVTVQESVPQWLGGQGRGWLTAEYSMLPASTRNRKAREGRAGRYDARSLEIQRLIGRTLRSVIDLKKLPELTLWIDCDVLDADGGTRTTAINGASVALFDALTTIQKSGRLPIWPMDGLVSAISVGLVHGEVLVDLDYREDSAADVDLNVVSLSGDRLVEVQGSAEGKPFDLPHLNSMVEHALAACREIDALQRATLGLATPEVGTP